VPRPLFALLIVACASSPLLAQEADRPGPVPPPEAEAAVTPRPGPLSVRGHSLFQIAAIDFVPDAPLPIARGAWEVHFSGTWINVFNYDPGKFVIDGEFVRASASFWYGMTEDVIVGAIVPVEYIGGGWLDGLIMDFHDAFDLGQGGREEFDTDEFQIVVGDEKRDARSAAYLGDITLAMQARLLGKSDAHPGLLLGWKLKLPTATDNDFHDTHGPAIGVTIAADWSVAGFQVYAGLGAAYVGNTVVIGEELERLQYSFLISVERVIVDRVSAVIQVLAQSPIARDFHEFSDWTVEVSTGIKIQVSKSVAFQWAVLENLFNFDNSPDVGVHAALVISR